jgi:hypothetical protein
MAISFQNDDHLFLESRIIISLVKYLNFFMKITI